MVGITLNGNACEAQQDATVLTAAAANGIYIPAVCHHPDLPPFANLPQAPKVFRGYQAYEDQPTSDESVPLAANGQSAIGNSQSATGTLEGCGLCVVEVDGLPEPARA
ncbi:MAG: 2Fe-2S iron-sulfur cluster-binding protein, partial [Planctomycetota bacterium]